MMIEKIAPLLAWYESDLDKARAAELDGVVIRLYREQVAMIYTVAAAIGIDRNELSAAAMRHRQNERGHVDATAR